MLFLRWLVSAISLFLVAQIVPGFHVENFWYALVAALVLGLLNLTVRPLLTILTLPVTIVTLGLFTLIINAVVIMIMASVVKGVTVDGFAPAFWGGLVLWLIGWFINSLGTALAQK
jgi:putative membrane protein